MKKLSLTNLNHPFFHALPLTAEISTMAEIPPTAPPEGATYQDNLSNQLRTATLAVDQISTVQMPPLPGEKSPFSTNDSQIVPPAGPVPVEFIDTAEQPSPQQINLRNIERREATFEKGYDSDGEIGPFSDALEQEGRQDFDEDAVCEMDAPPLTGPVVGVITTAPPPPPPPPIHIPIEASVLEKMKKPQLTHELKIRGLPAKASTNKETLKRSLVAALAAKTVVCGEIPVVRARRKDKEVLNEVGKTFAPTAKWRVLTPNEEVAEEPNNENFRLPRAPTIDERDAQFVPVKHNFDESIDIPVFKGMGERDVRFSNGTKKFNTDGSNMKETFVRNHGSIKSEFAKKHNINQYTRPDEYARLFLPFKKNMVNGKEMVSLELLTKWTNTKAILAGAGRGGSCYQDFRPFTVEEVQQHLGLYVFNGVAPSPRIELKFKPQRLVKVHGNDFIARSFGPNAERRHRHFKAFFATQNPVINQPSRKLFPNWKVRPLLAWMNFIFPVVWLLGKAFSIDEMTMGFQGKHVDKRRITYKNEGDGFQGDALCGDGFTYQVYMRNDPAPRKYIRQGLSPLHSRVMALFDSVEEDHHQCAMDNLYNSATFCRAAYNHENKVLCHGVTRKGGRGIPPSIIQTEVINREAQTRVRGTVKAAVLEGDPGCPGLTATSIYDTKPVHYLSMVSEKLKWIVKERLVYNVDTGKSEILRFLRMCNIDEYNRTMGNVDIADQLRGSYRFDHWLRNRKWWWSILFWAIGVMLTNAYVMYVTVCDEYDIPKRDRKTHLEFRKDIALAWINPKEYMADQKQAAAKTPMSRRRKRDDASGVSGITLDSALRSTVTEPSVPTQPTKKLKRTVRMSDDALDPTAGKLSCRLDHTLDHIPIRPHNSKVRCSIHRWVGVETQKDVFLCPSCDVNLCVDCYHIFHHTENMVMMKKSLSKKYSKRK